MQDRYVGDIGDYGKLALLRELQSCGLSIAVNWYLVDPIKIEKNSDGTFKQQDGRHLIPEKLKICDNVLAKKLTEIAQSDRRSVIELEKASFVPGAIYYKEPISVDKRSEWHNKALQEIKSADLVFVDPDNGLLVQSVGMNSSRSVKYAFYEEIRDYIQQEQSVLIYNHRSRKKEGKYFSEICEKLQKATGKPETEILKITFPRYSVRDYLAVPASEEHREKIESAFNAMVQGIWGRTGMCRLPLSAAVACEDE